MTIISQQIKDPPTLNSFYVGTPVYGSGLALIGDRINFLAYAKSRRLANCYFTTNHHSTWTENTTLLTQGTALTYGYITKQEQDEEFPSSNHKDIIFTCSSNARFLGVILTYNCNTLSNYIPSGSDAYIRLKMFTGATKNNAVGARTYIDAGIEWSISNSQLSNTTNEVTHNDTHVITYDFIASSGEVMEVPISGEYSVMTSPRPLFIPTAYRGTEIGIEITTSYTRLCIASIHELFEGVPV